VSSGSPHTARGVHPIWGEFHPVATTILGPTQVEELQIFPFFPSYDSEFKISFISLIQPVAKMNLTKPLVT
jgi:hypothetical protein